jgi:hypothetical protein
VTDRPHADPRVAIFWGAIAQAAWTLAGYPLALRMLPARPWRQDEQATPPVTILMSAYYEADELRLKLEALRELDYPAERLQVIVMSDGTPELIEIARDAYPRAEAILMPERGGKPKALNEGMTRATGDVIVLTDANNPLDPASVRAAVRHFADPSIWAVAGLPAESGSMYDRYESALQRLESRSGSVAGLSGGWAAVRRERLPPFTDQPNEDLWLLCNLVRAGGRVVHEPRASSREPMLDAAKEMRRRTRLGAGRVMLVSELHGLPAGYRWRLLSHKFGRLVLPFSLAAALAGSLSLARRPGYAAAAAAQVAGYGVSGLAIAGIAPPGRAGRLARAGGQFVLGNVAVARGVVRGLRGRQPYMWDPTRR